MVTSIFQKELVSDMKPGVWYDVYQNQGTGGEVLPDWFYRQQTQAMSTLRPMLEAKLIEGRNIGGLPQVRKAKGEQ